VSISGGVAVVGTSTATTAYVFIQAHGGTNNWGEVKVLTASDGSAVNDRFGASVSTISEVAIVGKYGDGVNGNDSGSAYRFARNLGGLENWGELQKLSPNDSAPGIQFGFSRHN